MNTLLVDEAQAREFCRTFLVPYKKPRLFQCMARRKYADGQMSKGAIFLERSILTMDNQDPARAEDNFIRELRKVEVLAQAGMYRDPKHDNPIKLEWVVTYLSAFPLDEDDACDEFILRVLERRKDRRRSLIKRPELVSSTSIAIGPSFSRAISQMQTCLHKSPCRRYRMLKLDVDTKDPALLSELYRSMCHTTLVIALETRGGYHVVVERGGPLQKLFLFAKNINSTIPKGEEWLTIEDTSGPMIAIAGTNQGGFLVRIATEEWKEAFERAKAAEEKE